MLCGTAQNGRAKPGYSVYMPHVVMPSLQFGLSTVALILVALWVLGSVASFTLGGGLHVFLFVAVAMMLPRMVLGRKAAN